MFMFKGSSETFFSHLLSGLAVDCLSTGGSQPKTTSKMAEDTAGRETSINFLSMRIQDASWILMGPTKVKPHDVPFQ